MAAKNTKHVNLLPQEDFERTTLGRIMKWALTSFRFIVIVVELVVVASFLLRFWFDVQISDLEDEIEQKSALISSKSSFEKEFRKTQNKLLIFSTITADSNLSLPLLEAVSASLPADTQLTEFTRTDRNLQLTGATLSENSIARLITNLKENPRFASVNLVKIETKKDSTLVEFILNLTLS